MALGWIGGEWAWDGGGAPPLSFRAESFFGRSGACPCLSLWASGRAALRAAVAALGGAGRPVLVPAFGCAALSQAVAAAGGRPVFYPGDGRGGLDAGALRALAARSGAALAVVVHAWGLRQPLADLRGAGLRLIEDCSHTLCNAPGAGPAGPPLGAAAVASLRKVLPVAAGGICCLWEGAAPAPGAEPGFAAAREAALGLPPGPGRHRRLQAAEALLDRGYPDGPLPPGAARTLAALAAAPPGRQAAWRRACRRNRRLLLALLSGTACRPLHPELPRGVCPPGLVVRHPDRTQLAAALLREGIEAVLQWPVLPAARPALRREERLLAGTVLTLPCDGRCGESDLARVASAVRRAEASLTRPCRSWR